MMLNKQEYRSLTGLNHSWRQRLLGNYIIREKLEFNRCRACLHRVIMAMKNDNRATFTLVQCQEGLHLDIVSPGEICKYYF